MYADKIYHQILQCSLPLLNGISELLQCTLPFVTGNIRIAFHVKYANITVSANVQETFIVDTMFSDKCRLWSVSSILTFIKLTRTLVSGDEMTTKYVFR